MSVFLRGLHIASKQAAYLLVILATILLILVGAFYWMAYAVDKREDEITAWVGDKIGYPIEVGTAGLGWVGLMPKLQIEAVTVFRQDNKTELLTIESLYAGLDLIASIKQGEPTLNDISLTGLNTTLVRDLTGHYQLQGLNENAAMSPTAIDWLRWKNLLNRFQIDAVTIDYIDQINDSLSGIYQITNAQLNHLSENWTAVGSLILPPTLGTNVQFSLLGQLESDNFQDSHWQWQAQINDLMLAPFAQQIEWQDVAIKKARIAANISARGVGDTFDTVKTTIDLTQMELASKHENVIYTPVLIDQLTGEIDWQQQGQSWQLSGRKIELKVNGNAWQTTTFSIKKQHQDSWIIASDYLRLSDITAVASLSDKSPKIITEQKPAGDINNLKLHYSAEKGIMRLVFKLGDGAMLPWQNYPGVTGLTASVNWQQGYANLQLDSHKVTLYPEVWLDDAVFFDSITGVLNLEHHDGDWALRSQALRFWNDDLTLQLDGTVQHSNDGKINNDLKITMEEVIINRWQSYVPQKILSKGFKAWSKNAFLDGKIIDGTIELKGELAAFPYKLHPEKGHFKMALQAEGVQLHYSQKWPDLIAVKGMITGSANDLVIKSQSGKIAGFDFTDVTTTINNLAEAKPILRVDGLFRGTTSNALLFLQNSPLKGHFGQVAKATKAQGNSNIKLNLMVPLADIAATKTSGYVSFIDSQLQPKFLPEMNISNINGKLNFSNHAVTATNIKASLLDAPVNINITRKGDETFVSAMGHISTQQIQQHWPENMPKFISGKTPYQLVVSVSEEAVGDFNIDASIQSDLQGIEINMPEPFGKTSDLIRHFRIATKKMTNTYVYSAEYAKLLNIILANDDRQWRGEINVGNAKAELPEHGIKIRGELAELSLDSWYEWSQQHSYKTDKSGTFINNIDDTFVTIAKLSGFNQQFTNFTLSAKKDGLAWQATINSDQSKGDIYWPTDFNSNAVLKVHLDKLKIVLAESDTNKWINDDQAKSLWPSMDLAIGSLYINDMVLGELKLSAHRMENRWLMDQGSLRSDEFSASVSLGEWQQLSSGAQSHFKVQATSDHLAGLLASLGYQQAIDAENVDFQADFSWPNAPLAITKDQLNGSLKMAVGKGRLKDVQPGAAGRIFGLMSIAALPRRLSLDFSDLFSKGFYFDSIKGSFKFADGQAVTNDFILTGSSATIEVAGPVDLVRHTYDQEVTITPNVSSTLPLAGAVYGGPVGLGVGTAIMLVDKLAGALFDKNIVNLISYNYYLTGPWDSPLLTVSQPSEP
jgi:uncharacterized protein (TIGR02099 family)